jgi:proton-translocating NADH-quinone oxidoreductase chain N
MPLKYFLDDWLLLLSLPALLSLTFFGSSNPDESFERKKTFFIQLRTAQMLLLCVFFLTAFIGLQLLSLSSQEQLLLHAGNFFFRKDLLTLAINAVITLGGFYYFYLVGFVFLRTKTTLTYVPEIPFLVLSTLLSLRLFIATNDLLLMAFLLEISAFCSVILVSLQSVSDKKVIFPLEAGIKYFIINAVAISLFLLAMTIYFFLTGSLNVINISLFFQSNPVNLLFSYESLFFAQLLFFFSFFIKIGAAPVHHWVPDVYEGAETLFTTFLVLIISPPLVFKLILLFKQLILNGWSSPYFLIFIFKMFGFTSIILGTINAFYQTKIKRFIAYAGLTHLGFMLVALATANVMGFFSSIMYLVVYYITNIGFFTIFLLAQAEAQNQNQQLIYINQLKPFFHESKFYFYLFAIIFFSFAGIPPFAGFFIKFFVLTALLNQSSITIVIFLIMAILIGTFMYLRFFKVALFETYKPRSSSTHRLAKKNFSEALHYFYVFRYFSDDFESKNLISFWEAPLICGLFFISIILLGFIIFLPLFCSTILNMVFIILTTY